MPVLRDRFNWRGFTNLFARNRATGYLLGVGLVVVVAVAVLGSLWAALSVSEDNAAAKENEAWIREFSSSEDSELSGETRKILAAGLLDWDGQGVDVDLTEEQAEAFAVTAEEGTTPELDTTRGSWDYWGLGLRIWLPVSYLYFAWTTFGIYAYETHDRNNFLADLPWRRVWPVLFVLFGGAGPFFVGSAVRVWRAQRRVQIGTADSQFEEFDGDEEDKEVSIPVYRGYREDSKVAKATYVELRTKLWRQRFTERRQSAERELEYTQVRLRDLGTQIQDTQSRLGNLKSGVQQLKDAEHNAKNAPELQHVESEYDRLLSLPGVVGIRVVNDDQLCLLVKARSQYRGTLYDFGDWELRFGPGSYSIRSQRLRSGVRSSWTRLEPPYHNRDGSFCFGSREEVISAHAAKGQYLEAIELAVNCLHSVNEGSKHFIPSIYQEATD